MKQASKIDLFDGVDTGAAAALTRNEVAQLALNALEATMVEADGNGGTTITGNGFQITTGSTKYIDVTKTDATKWNAIDDTKDGTKAIVQLGEKLYDGKLTKNAADKDDLGHPAHSWDYKADDIGTYADKADYTVVAAEDYAGAIDAYKDLVDDEYDLTTSVATKYMNGDSKWSGAVKSGDVLEFYLKDNKVVRAVDTRYSIAQIDDISTKLTKAQKEDGNTCKITLNGESAVLNNDFAGFDAETYVEDAYILYVKSGSKVLASQVAESVEGEVTAKKGGDVKVDGTYYKDLTAKIAVGDEGTFYLNAAGQIMVTDTTSKSDDYAYIYNVHEDTGLNSDGVEGTTFTAYMVLADGTKMSKDVKTYKSDDGKFYFDEAKKVEITEDYKGVIAYSVNSDDELVYETAKDRVSGPTTLTVDKTHANGTDSKTEFIFTYVDGSKQKVSTATGYKNVNFASKDAYTVKNSDGDVLYVFVTAKNGSVVSDANLAVILDAEAVEGKNGDDKTFTYAVAIDGEETTLVFKGSKIANVEDGDVIAYEMNGDYAEIDDTADYETVASVYAATSDYVVFEKDGAQYNLGGDETVYTITLEYKDETHKDLESVTVSEGGKIEAKDKVVYTLDGSDLDVIYVYEVID